MTSDPVTTTWQPIETAPREPFAFDERMDDPRLPGRRLRMGPVVVLRGSHEGETEEFRAVWSVWDDQPGYWFDTEGEEPLDWPVDEWRPLTAAEQGEDADAD